MLLDLKHRKVAVLDIHIDQGTLEQHFLEIARGKGRMSAFLFGVALQWKLDIRSKTLLITCYIVPLLFFAIMGVYLHPSIRKPSRR